MAGSVANLPTLCRGTGTQAAYNRPMAEIKRRITVPVNVGGVWVGGNHPIAVQSMTNTDTADVGATAAQAQALALAGSELVRVTVNTREAAPARPHLVAPPRGRHITDPVLAEFHF